MSLLDLPPTPACGPPSTSPTPRAVRPKRWRCTRAGADQDTAYALVVDVASGTEAEVGRIAGRLRGL